VSARLRALYIRGNARHREFSKRRLESIRVLIWDRLPFHDRRKGAPAIGDGKYNMTWRSRSHREGAVGGATDGRLLTGYPR
jgi:hypothetical protein